MEYKSLSVSEITPGLFEDFHRRQEITDCWHKVQGQWVIHFQPRVIGDWNEQQLAFICHCLRETLEKSGMVAGALQDGKLKGIVAVNAEPLGSYGQYREMVFLQISRECRGQGIGRELFLLAKSFAKEIGGEKLYISSQSAVESQAFYKAMGCREAEEYSQLHVSRGPDDCQIECKL